jgi:hypothetical protein
MAATRPILLATVVDLATGMTQPVAAPVIVPSLAVDTPGRRLTLSWGTPTPSEGQQLAPLSTADRSLAP